MTRARARHQLPRDRRDITSFLSQTKTILVRRIIKTAKVVKIPVADYKFPFFSKKIGLTAELVAIFRLFTLEKDTY